MKVRTLLLFAIVMFLPSLEISAIDKETFTASNLKTEEGVQAQSSLPEQQQLEPTKRRRPIKSHPPDLESQHAISLYLQEKVLCEAQRSFDRSLSNISTLIDIFAIVLVVLGAILTFAIALGIFEFVKWRGIRKDAEQARDEAKEAAQIAKKEIKTIREIRKRAETELEKSRKETPELVSVSPEKPSEDYIKKIDDFGRRLDFVEVLGVSLKAEDFLKRGNLFFTRNEFEKAIVAYEKAIELDPKYAAAWANKGVALGNIGRYEEALSACEKAIELHPKYAVAWVIKGFTLSKLGRYEEAISAFEKAIEITPKDATAWNNKAFCLINLRRHEEALTAYEKAIELDPKYASAYYNRACIYSLKGDKNDVLRDLKKAIELDQKYKDEAREDDDFKNFWDDEDFKRIVE